MTTPVWFITGSSNGLGLLLSLRVLKAGHRVIATVRDTTRSADAIRQIEEAGGKIVTIDLTESKASITKKVQDAEKAYGRIDFLVNNAGYSVLGGIELFTEAEAEHQIQTNLFGPLYTIQAALPGMRSRGSSPTHVESSMASATKPIAISVLLLLIFTISQCKSREEDPTPAPWPHQFHSILFMNHSGSLQIIDLWYDWPNGRNFNIIQDQLGKLLYDLEWNNGTSFFYSLDSSKECRTAKVEVGILRPNWLDGANYLGQRHVNGFLCNVWEKVDFIWYYEDVVTKRPVLWIFYTGREAHVMTFEVGAVLEDAKWQAPVYCFEKRDDGNDPKARPFIRHSQRFSGAFA